MDRRAQIDERIKDLLLSTDLTFKQIIEKLRGENMSASFNTIRRVNRNHRYRKPRYDAKLTPSQRKELIVQLKNTQKPNLSSLARKYGVCHGSIWYWWDKLSKIREKNNGLIPDNEPSLEFDDGIDQEFLSGARQDIMNDADMGDDDDYGFEDPDSDPLDLDDRITGNNQNDDNYDINDAVVNQTQKAPGEDSSINLEDLKFVGPVQAKDPYGQYIRLPILMFSSSSSVSTWNTRTKAGSSIRQAPMQPVA